MYDMITTAWKELLTAFFSANYVLSNTKKSSQDGRLVVNAKMMANGFSWRENCEKYCVAFVLVSYPRGIWQHCEGTQEVYILFVQINIYALCSPTQ